MNSINNSLSDITVEFNFNKSCIWIDSINNILTNVKNLTLTRVVFEFYFPSRYDFIFVYLTLTSVVQKNKSCNKENFSMLQLFLLIL